MSETKRQVVIYVWTTQWRDGKEMKIDVERCRDIFRERFALEIDISAQVKALDKISDRPKKDALVRKALQSQAASSGERKSSVKWPLIAIDTFVYVWRRRFISRFNSIHFIFCLI
jgi:hypothetical protein